MPDLNVFHRPDYAEALAQQLLHPGPWDHGLRSGVFLSGIRRIGKTTFVRQDFIPALLDRGALALYVDLWTDPSRQPMALLHDAVRQASAELKQPGSSLHAIVVGPHGPHLRPMRPKMRPTRPPKTKGLPSASP